MEVHRRKIVIENLLEKTNQLQEAGAHLLWKRTSEDSDETIKYDVMLVFPPKGYHIINPLLDIIEQRLPQLNVNLKAHSKDKEEVFYMRVSDDYLDEAANLLGFQLHDKQLSSLQRQSIVLRYLNSLRWLEDDSENSIDNDFKLRFKKGEAIIAKLIKCNLIKHICPLHDETHLSFLRSQWVSAFFNFQPLDKICQYFGIKIAIYFAFLGYYTSALYFPAIFGLAITLLSNKYYIGEVRIILFSIFNVIWAVQFLQKWNRTSDQLVNRWSSMNVGTNEKLIRPLFRGSFVEVDGSGHVKLSYPKWKHNLFKYCISLPIIALSLIGVFGTVFYIFRFQTWWDEIVIGEKNYPQWTGFIPKITLAILIQLFDSLYYPIAIWLNNKENYQFEEAHENNLIAKLVLFEFGTAFSALFYIAFYLGDMDKLDEHLATLLITRQVIGNLKEALLPFIVESYKFSRKKAENTHDSITQGEFESSLLRYESTFDDYLEMVIQFGYVILFSPTFPLAAVCALVNNIIEIRSDAFKLCVVFQRPFAGDMVKDIGQWKNVLNMMVYLAIIVNCGLIAISGQLSKILPITSDVQIVLISVMLEHFLIALKWLSPFIA